MWCYIVLYDIVLRKYRSAFKNISYFASLFEDADWDQNCYIFKVRCLRNFDKI